MNGTPNEKKRQAELDEIHHEMNTIALWRGVDIKEVLMEETIRQLRKLNAKLTFQSIAKGHRNG